MRYCRIIPLLLLLSACDPAAVTGNLTDRAARSVVVNVLVNQYPRPQAETATTCVLSNASPTETEALARDVGTRAGTVTVANIRTIGDRPATKACLAAQGLIPIAVVP
jgi:hypothetical protein